MAQETGTYSTYDAAGNREDLTDIIYNISPTETPFMTSAGRVKAKGTKHEWQIDALAAAADDNVAFEGDEAAFAAPAATTRIGNYTHISDKTAMITGTQESVDKAGRRSEMAYQLAKRMKELKTDLEKQMCANKASIAGNDTTARQSGSVRAWLETNDDLPAAGSPASGGYNTGTGVVDAATTGTARAFLESDLKSVLLGAWTQGGDPSLILLDGFNKQVMSGFTGHSTRMDKGEDKRLTAAYDVYVSDFGDHRVVPSRFMSANVYALTPRLWKVAYLRPFKVSKIAKTGDNEKRLLVVEYTLCSLNEKGSGCVADVTVS